jgi:hypothetical protein
LIVQINAGGIQTSLLAFVPRGLTMGLFLLESLPAPYFSSPLKQIGPSRRQPDDYHFWIAHDACGGCEGFSAGFVWLAPNLRAWRRFGGSCSRFLTGASVLKAGLAVKANTRHHGAKVSQSYPENSLSGARWAYCDFPATGFPGAVR